MSNRLSLVIILTFNVPVSLDIMNNMDVNGSSSGKAALLGLNMLIGVVIAWLLVIDSHL